MSFPPLKIMKKEKVTLLDVIEHYRKRNEKIDENLRKIDQLKSELRLLESKNI